MPARGPATAARRAGWAAFAPLLLAALVLYVAVAAATPGYVWNMNDFKSWAKWVDERGIENTYRTPINYPPGNLYLLGGVGTVYRALIDPKFDERQARSSRLLTFMLKLPSVVFLAAVGALVYAVVVRRQGARLGLVAGAATLFNPALIFGSAHRGDYDPVHTCLCLLSVAALAAGRTLPAGVAIGLAALAKPQSWVLLPLVAVVAWRERGMAGLLRCAAGGAAALLVGLSPFIVHDRLADLALLPGYMNSHTPSGHMISANAHNLWWLPTLLRGRWIDDSEPLLGPLAYRWVALALVALVVLACLARLLRRDAPPNLYLLAATLVAGWFFFTPRAHENHAFMVLPFLAAAWGSRAGVPALYGLASLGVLANMVLEDPLLVGRLASAAENGQAMPGWWVGLTAANVALYAAAVVGCALLLRTAAAVSRPAEARAVRAAG